MKKLLAMGLACAVVLAPAFSVHAAQEVQTCHIGGCNLGECFMDTDGDGICGNHYFVDENGDGICDFHCYTDVNADGVCDFFVDADEDGICDHCHDHGNPVLADTLDGATSTTVTPDTPTVTYTAPAATYVAPAPTVTYTPPAVTYDDTYYYYGCHGGRHHGGGHHGYCW
ncbi:MAG: hypothetical protein K2P39_10420 [Lachnospiraceae bacterium]|nr:hypothetical protein [Lachnospiraceae bacterium]